MTKSKAETLAAYWTMKNDQGEYLQSSLDLREPTAAHLRAQDALIGELVEALTKYTTWDVATFGETKSKELRQARQALAKAEAAR